MPKFTFEVEVSGNHPAPVDIAAYLRKELEFWGRGTGDFICENITFVPSEIDCSCWRCEEVLDA